MEEFNELIAENKKDVEALAGRGTVYGNLFRYEKAIPDLDYAIDLDPQNAHWWVVRGTIRMKQYNFRGAIKDLDEAVKLDPNRSEAYLVRGQVLARQKKWAAAIAALTQAINLDSGNASAYLARADVYQAKGDADLAKADRAQVGRLNPHLLAPPSGKELMEQEAPQIDAKVGQHRRSERLVRRMIRHRQCAGIRRPRIAIAFDRGLATWRGQRARRRAGNIPQHAEQEQPGQHRRP